MSARSTKEFKTQEDILSLIYQRIFSPFQERMRTAVTGIGDPALQFRVTLETTLNLCNELQEAVLLPYHESHALSRQTLQNLMEVDRLYVSVLEEILHTWKKEGVFRVKEPNLVAISLLCLCGVWVLKRWNLSGFHRIVHFSTLEWPQTSAQAPQPRWEVHDG